MNSRKKYISLAIIMFSFTFGGYLLGNWLWKFESLRNFIDISKKDLIIIIPGFLLIFSVVLIIHELGHLIAGLLAGFRFQLFVVGFLGIRRNENGKIRVYFNSDLNLFGGAVLTLPVTIEKSNAIRFAWTLLAGPAFSMIFTFLLFFLSINTDQPFRFIFLAGSLFSLITFFATTIPSKTGIFYTDRKRFQRLIKKGKEQQTELALLKATGIQMSGDSISQLSPDEIESIKNDQSPVIKYAGYFYDYLYRVENKGDNLQDIIGRMDELAEKLPKSILHSFNKELSRRI